ncbi:MAG: hypothetical protein JWM31_3268, partial [Solirubrobacterales bacterium]|nr:hypothetical protein [Solirubrobacterales bacterium]
MNVPRVMQAAAVTAGVLLGGGSLTASAPAATATLRVVGGSTAATTPGWMTQVWVRDATALSFCGGELVSSRWV